MYVSGEGTSPPYEASDVNSYLSFSLSLSAGLLLSEELEDTQLLLLLLLVCEVWCGLFRDTVGAHTHRGVCLRTTTPPTHLSLSL